MQDTLASTPADRLWKPGQSGNPAGKPPGAISKFNRSIKDMIERALHKAGGVDYLVEQAHKNPVAFMGLLAKVLPTQLQGTDANGTAWVIRIPIAPETEDAWLQTYAPAHLQHQGTVIDGKATEATDDQDATSAGDPQSSGRTDGESSHQQDQAGNGSAGADNAGSER